MFQRETVLVSLKKKKIKKVSYIISYIVSYYSLLHLLHYFFQINNNVHQDMNVVCSAEWLSVLIGTI